MTTKITKSSYEIEYSVEWNDNISRHIVTFVAPKLNIQGVYLLRDQDFDGYALMPDIEDFIYINFLNAVKQVEQQQKLDPSSEPQSGENVSN